MIAESEALAKELAADFDRRKLDPGVVGAALTMLAVRIHVQSNVPIEHMINLALAEFAEFEHEWPKIKKALAEKRKRT